MPPFSVVSLVFMSPTLGTLVKIIIAFFTFIFPPIFCRCYIISTKILAEYKLSSGKTLYILDYFSGNSCSIINVVTGYADIPFYIAG